MNLWILTKRMGSPADLRKSLKGEGTEDKVNGALQRKHKLNGSISIYNYFPYVCPFHKQSWIRPMFPSSRPRSNSPQKNNHLWTELWRWCHCLVHRGPSSANPFGTPWCSPAGCYGWMCHSSIRRAKWSLHLKLTWVIRVYYLDPIFVHLWWHFYVEASPGSRGSVCSMPGTAVS